MTLAISAGHSIVPSGATAPVTAQDLSRTDVPAGEAGSRPPPVSLGWQVTVLLFRILRALRRGPHLWLWQLPTVPVLPQIAVRRRAATLTVLPRPGPGPACPQAP